jgi:hypothetical protein
MKKQQNFLCWKSRCHCSGLHDITEQIFCNRFIHFYVLRSRRPETNLFFWVNFATKSP